MSIFWYFFPLLITHNHNLIKTILSSMIHKLEMEKIIRITLLTLCHVWQSRIGDPATCIRESEKLSCPIYLIPSQQSKFTDGAPWKTTCATVANCPAVIGSVYGV